MFDLAIFRKLNDAEGHPAGNQVLAAFDHLLAEDVRAGDLAARYGGESFVVIQKAPADPFALCARLGLEWGTRAPPEVGHS